MPENRRIVRAAVSTAIDSHDSGKQFLRIEAHHGVAYFMTDQPCGLIGSADNGS